MPSLYSATEKSGKAFRMRSCAVSRKQPLGVPSAARSMRPFLGSGVALVIPANSIALELAHRECRVSACTTIGISVEALSRASLCGPSPGKHASKYPCPRNSLIPGLAAMKLRQASTYSASVFIPAKLIPTTVAVAFV